MIADKDRALIIEGARQHNLKNLSLRLPQDCVTVITGVSGSGKSSLAFDTIFAEGQWRYIESLSTYARMFLEKVDRPDVDRIENIRPAIAIQQKNPVRTARSTVGTATEVHDYLRLLFAKIGRTICPTCRIAARAASPTSVAHEVCRRPDLAGRTALVLFTVAMTPARQMALLARGFSRVKVGQEIRPLDTLDTIDAISPSSPPSPRRGEGKPETQTVQIVLDRLILAPDQRSRLAESLETAVREGGGTAVIAVDGHESVAVREGFRCPRCGTAFEPPQPILFSFNHPVGACPDCKGFGNILRYDEDLVIPDKHRSLAQGAIEPWTKPAYRRWFRQLRNGLAGHRPKVGLTTPYARLTARQREVLFQGAKGFHGIHDFFEHLKSKRYKLHVRVFLSRYRSPVLCQTCRGTRLTPRALAVQVGGLTIAEVSALTIEGVAAWLDRLALTPAEQVIVAEVLRQLTMKVGFLRRVGLGYLTFDRLTRTLSGGEAQRIALANQLGAQLTGTLYVLDEPSIGLHARDTAILAQIVRDLAAGGNTVLMVEHDTTLIHAADHVVELGPWSGERGGEVVFAGEREAFLQTSDSLTARYLRGEEQIPLPARRRPGSGQALVLTGARAHNLKGIDLTLPLGTLTVITGVSGSGKSTLIHETLYYALARAFRIEQQPIGPFDKLYGLEHLGGVRLIDQEPIGRTPRSNPITYLKAFDDIRRLFAAQPEATRRGLTARHFSFNTTGGRCEACQGNGTQRLEMYIFEDLDVTCESCDGRRFQSHVLAVRVHGRSIHDVLQMTVDDALEAFPDSPRLQRTLQLMREVGLGYLRLGQPAPTLSGGEAQRLKVCAELAGTRSRHVLYLLDEPTTGLHVEDVKRLLGVLNRLVDEGHTVVVIEHHLDVIKSADYLVDLGPEGGDRGGELVAAGTPDEVMAHPTSYTGQALRQHLSSARAHAV